MEGQYPSNGHNHRPPRSGDMPPPSRLLNNVAPSQAGVGASQRWPLDGQGNDRPLGSMLNNMTPSQTGVGASQRWLMERQFASYGNDRPQAGFVQPGGMLNNMVPSQVDAGASHIQPIGQRFSYQPLQPMYHTFQPPPLVFPSAELGYHQPGFVPTGNELMLLQSHLLMQQQSHPQMYQSAGMLHPAYSYQGLGQGQLINQSVPIIQPSGGGAGGIEPEQFYLPLADRSSIPLSHPALGSHEKFLQICKGIETSHLNENIKEELPSEVDLQAPCEHSEPRIKEEVKYRLSANATSAAEHGKEEVKPELPKTSHVTDANSTSDQMLVRGKSSLAYRDPDMPYASPAPLDSVTSASEHFKEIKPELPKASQTTDAITDQKPVQGKSSLSCRDTDMPHATSVSQPSETGQSIVGLKKATPELFEASPSPSDFTVAQYVKTNGPLVRRYRMSTSDYVVIPKRKGAKLVRKAICYIIRAYRAGKCWGGDFEDKHLMLGSDGSFYLSLEPNAPCTKFYFLEDLGKLMEKLIEHCKVAASGVSAIYFLHLSHTCKKPPQSIISSDLHFERFIDFVIHHPCFGHPMNRSDFISGAGQWLKYCSDPDIEIIRARINEAAIYTGRDPYYDWRQALDEPLLLVLWKGIPPPLRWGEPPTLKDTPEDQFIFCRHTNVHFFERTRHPVPVEDSQVQTPHHAVPVEVEDTENQTSQGIFIQFTPTPVESDYMIGSRYDTFVAESIFRILLDDTLNPNPYVKERWNAFKRSLGGSVLEDEDEEGDEDGEGCPGSGPKRKAKE